MIWIILFFIIILVSAVLAFRSMKDYEEFPESLSVNALFFVGSSSNFTQESLKKLHEVLSGRKQFFSLERLNKGKERALAIFGPREIVEILPELNLVEIEDYLVDPAISENSSSEKKVSVNETLTRLVEPKLNSKKPLHVGEEIKNLELADNQKIFIQVVCIPEGERESEYFQSTIRVLVVDDDSIEKVALAKKVKQIWEEATGLHFHEDNFPEQKKFESFKQRTLIPKEVASCTFSGHDVLSLVS